ncbi:hypothetical protein ACHAWX_004056 [Stephanocyclus meneghinianus]
MSTIRLPCHKGLGRPDGSSGGGRGNGSSGGTNRFDNGKTTPIRLRPGQIPYVSHDDGKTRYYADRFYMDAPTGLLEHRLREKSQKQYGVANPRAEFCDYCGEKCQQASTKATLENENEPSGSPARPLFDRAAFINSLDLSAAIIATYKIGDLEFLSETFPSLFPHPDAKNVEIVPTLVLHGHRGWKLPGKRQFDKRQVGETLDEEVDQNRMNRDFECMDATTDELDVQNYPQDDVSLYCENTNSLYLEKYEGDSGPCRPKKNTVKELAERGMTNDTGKEHVNCQSPAKNHCGRLLSPVQNVVSCDQVVVNQYPVLTYENETLNIKSTPRKRNRKTWHQPDKARQCPMRSPRRSPPGRKEVNSQCAGKCPRQKSRLVQQSQEVSRIGSTPMDAIVLDSDSENDGCNNSNLVEITNVDDGTAAKSNKALLELSKIEAKKKVSSCLLESLPISPGNDTAPTLTSLSPPVRSYTRQPMPDEQLEFKLRAPQLSVDSYSIISRKRLKMMHTSHSAAAILARSFGSVPDVKLMKPLSYPSTASDSSGDESDCIDRDVVKNPCVDYDSMPQYRIHDVEAEAGSSDLPSSASVFGGQVFFTQILPRWIPPKEKKRLKKKENNANSDAPELETVRGCHHPKFFLLFEKRGSLVVIVSTANLTQQDALDASWVQRFEPQNNFKNENLEIDYGMAHDFGYVLTDLLRKQSEAAENQGMLPDTFLRMHVPALFSGGLSDLARRYKFEDSHVHLVSTAPGDYCSNLPKRGVESCFNRPPYRHPTITYGPQRVSYILSRVLDKTHISVACATIPRGIDQVGEGGGTAAVTPWLPPSLLAKSERLVIQSTSMSGSWTREELEILARSYLEPHWKFDNELDYNSPIDLIDIVWPSMDYFNLMHDKRRALIENHQVVSAVSKSKKFEKSARRPCHVFLSSVNFSKLDRVCISRMALFEPSIQSHMASYETASLHFKSYCRLLCFPGGKSPKQKSTSNSTTCSSEVGKSSESKKEYISWFMLSSACLSKGAQGQPTPYRPIESDSMSYANFELGVLFCSRLLGDRLNDRLYVFDSEFSGGCQCGTGKRWYKDLLRQNDNIDEPNENYFSKTASPAFLGSVRKVHLPIPFQLRPKPYQEDPESDFMSYTPFFHEIPDGTGDVGNMKLTPYGRQISRENSKTSGMTESS